MKSLEASQRGGISQESHWCPPIFEGRYYPEMALIAESFSSTRLEIGWIGNGPMEHPVYGTATDI